MSTSSTKWSTFDCGSALGVLTSLAIIIALPLNNISGYKSSTGAAEDLSIKCKWNGWCVGSQCTDWSNCDTVRQCPANISGKLWLAFSTIAIFLVLVSVLIFALSFNFYPSWKSRSRWLFFVSALCCLFANGIWMITNTSNTDTIFACYDKNEHIEGYSLYIGSSMIFIWIAMGLNIISTGFTLNGNIVCINCKGQGDIKKNVQNTELRCTLCNGKGNISNKILCNNKFCKNGKVYTLLTIKKQCLDCLGTGQVKTMNMSKPIACESCNGKGEYAEKDKRYINCKGCNGKGYSYIKNVKCKNCNGVRYTSYALETKKCDICSGKGGTTFSIGTVCNCFNRRIGYQNLE